MEAEANVLGPLIIGMVGIDEIASVVREEDFYGDKNRIVFQAAQELQRQGRQQNLVTVADQLKSLGKLEWVTADYLSDLGEVVSNPASWIHYAREVRDFAIRRQMRMAAMRMAERADRPQDTVDEILEQTEQDVFAIRRHEHEVGEEGMADLVRSVMDDITDRCLNPGLRGAGTGYRSVDELVGGMTKGSLNIVAALPSMGKTAYAMNVALNQREGKVLFFSLEMSRQDIARNAMCNLAGVDADRARRGVLTPSEREELSGAYTGPMESLLILDPPAAKVGAVRALSRRYCAKHDVRLIVVDYLGLMYSGKESRYVDAGNVALGMKCLAREVSVPVLLLSQLSRGVWTQDDQRPNLSHLRDSGDIEAHADTVCFVHRPGYFKKDGDDTAEIIVAKNRLGRTGTARLRFEPQTLRFQ